MVSFYAQKKSERAYTLIEVVVAIFIVGMVAVLYSVLVSMYPLTRETGYKALALRVASEELGELRAGGYDALPANGSFSNTQLALLPSGSGTVSVAAYNAKTKAVTVTVSWQSAGKSAQSLSLDTLITQIGGL